MKKKKIILIIILILVIGFGIVVLLNPGNIRNVKKSNLKNRNQTTVTNNNDDNKNKNDNNSNNNNNKGTITKNIDTINKKDTKKDDQENKENTENVENTENKNNQEKVTIKKIKDGTLYEIDKYKDIKPNMIIGDNYYDTQLRDIMLDFNKYSGKIIEIEGMYLPSEPYTMVGRYSTSQVCPFCSGGYSYIEYQFKGDKLPTLENEKSWIKIVGKIEKGNDESSGYQDYFYIDAYKLYVMDNRGKDTVNN